MRQPLLLTVLACFCFGVPQARATELGVDRNPPRYFLTVGIEAVFSTRDYVSDSTCFLKARGNPVSVLVPRNLEIPKGMPVVGMPRFGTADTSSLRDTVTLTEGRAGPMRLGVPPEPSILSNLQFEQLAYIYHDHPGMLWADPRWVQLAIGPCNFGEVQLDKLTGLLMSRDGAIRRALLAVLYSWIELRVATGHIEVGTPANRWLEPPSSVYRKCGQTKRKCRDAAAQMFVTLQRDDGLPYVDFPE